VIGLGRVDRREGRLRSRGLVRLDKIERGGAMSRQRKTRIGSDKPVTSKIEITKPSKGGGLIQYRLQVTANGKKIKDFAVKLNPNLLSIKMSLMVAVKEVEEMLKSRRVG